MQGYRIVHIILENRNSVSCIGQKDYMYWLVKHFNHDQENISVVFSHQVCNS